MRLSAGMLSLPKTGASRREYEDAWACPTACAQPSPPLRCAMADGASESSYARLWAQILVRSFAQGEWDPQRDDRSQLDRLRRRWLRIVSRRPLPWYAAEKVRLGAYATFIGVELSAPHGAIVPWRAAALGDSCLFQLHGDEIVTAFPIASRGDFPARPFALCSRPGEEQSVLAICGEAHAGDSFLMMTDALGRWFLAQREAGGRPWRTLLRLSELGAPAFARWVRARRASGAMGNDDVTFAWLALREV